MADMVNLTAIRCSKFNSLVLDISHLLSCRKRTTYFVFVIILENGVSK